jgi:hypothetical protein
MSGRGVYSPVWYQVRAASRIFPVRCCKFVIGAYPGLAYCVQRLIFAICKMVGQLPVEGGKYEKAAFAEFCAGRSNGEQFCSLRRHGSQRPSTRSGVLIQSLD